MALFTFTDRDTLETVTLTSEEIIEDLQESINDYGDNLVDFIGELLATLDDWQLEEIRERLEAL